MEDQHAVEARLLALQQDGATASILAPPEHPLDRFQASFPMYDRWLPRLAAAVDTTAPGESMIDVGANIGDTVAAWRLAGTSAPVVAVEPSDRYFLFLRENIARDAELFRGVEPLQAFIGPPGTTMSLTEASGTAVPTLVGDGPSSGVPTMALAEVGAGPVSLVKTDTDGFDARIVLENVDFLRDRRPVLWAEAEVHNPELQEEWGRALTALRTSHPLVVVFDNFGFPLLRGHLEEVQPALELTFDYIRRHRATAPEVGGPPTIYYLDLAFFPDRFDGVHDAFVRRCGLA